MSNDNALVESKNGSVVRKHLGYAHIPGRFAAQVNAFTQGILSPYLNFHRPCFFPTEAIDDKGRVCKRYRYEDMMTPYDKLKSLPDADQHQYIPPGRGPAHVSLQVALRAKKRADAVHDHDRPARGGADRVRHGSLRLDRLGDHLPGEARLESVQALRGKTLLSGTPAPPAGIAVRARLSERYARRSS
ncbi:hypothetical protein [Alkalilimnicola ehrlichii]|uniref:hypothetical protein n=1 Tax=Alkalilimnicola ehrlichii TaxID=351052 RepID=UPI003BA3CA18